MYFYSNSFNIYNFTDKLRQKDLEQAILLEEKLALHYSLFVENQNSNLLPDAIASGPGVEAFLSGFGSYKDLITDDCDTVEIWKRVIMTVQEISHIASTLYSAATGLPLSRSFSSVGERQSESYISPILPKRAETFGGFDEKRSKGPPYHPNHHRDSAGAISNFPITIRDNQTEMVDNNVVINKLSEGSMTTLASTTSTHGSNATTNTVKSSSENLRDHNFAALQVTHNLHMLLMIIQQQMTTIQSLQSQLLSFRENQKSIYRHDDQLEELRNLQDRIQEEKTSWLKAKENQERDLEERRQEQLKLQEQIRIEQDDIKQQRDQLYRKMEILSSQGLLLSPSVALPIPVSNQSEDYHTDEYSVDGSSTADRRKQEKWKTATSKNIKKTLNFF